MPPRSSRLRIEDMLATIDSIQSYTAGMTFEAILLAWELSGEDYAEGRAEEG